AVVVALAGAGVWGWLAVQDFLAGVPAIPPRDQLVVVNQAPAMTFEDMTGQVIATRGPKHGQAVSLAELPPYVPEAFLAAEDRRFYQHGAVDLRGIARAAWVNFRAHRTVQGGSTLTQQLAKTLFLSPEQTLNRKLQEAVIAWRLQQAMSKDEVLELYLNRIFFGDNAYGVDAAAQIYFGVPARSLSLPQAALLAALPKAPTRLALTNDMTAALARSHMVLRNMRSQGWITTDQEQAAMNAPPHLAPEAQGEGDFGYVLDMAAAEAVKIAGGQAPDLVVRLTINPTLQAVAQGVVRQTIAQEGRAAGVSQGALVLLGGDGSIRALVGGTDHHLSAFNRATQAQRQPGSSFKPIVYATALENGVQPTDVRVDGPVEFDGWTPTNYEPGFRGPVTVAEALAQSINTVAARLASEVGGGRIADMAHRFGIKSIPDDPQLSIALGSYEVNLLELTGAYQVFQQAGQRVTPYLVDQIATTRGAVLYSHVASAGLPVYDQGHAGQMVRMMEGVITHGTGTRAAIGRPAAGKTGTTQNWRDAWFVGFTPDWVCGVWIGNDDNAPMNKIVGGAIPAEIWRRMMLAAHQNLPVRDFPWLPPEPAAPETDGQLAVADPDQAGADQTDADQGDGMNGDRTDAPPAAAPDADADRAPRYQPRAGPAESPYPDPDYPPPWGARPQQPYETGPER
ncbi:MAG: PBP1A family penicillin-binding protein, partial [Caulobacteraceae bacterium]|nr:PBP1A family penicillin-binding protein [Caulobacteraceae bacterium]